MNLEVFRQDDTVYIRDADSPTLDEWPLPAEVWAAVVMRGDFTYTTSEDQPITDGFPPVWGQTPPAADGPVFARDNPDRRATDPLPLDPEGRRCRECYALLPAHRVTCSWMEQEAEDLRQQSS